MLLVAAGCGTLLGAEVIAEHDGHSIDPTDAMNFDQFRLQNDTAGVLYVRVCRDAACRRFIPELDWTPVKPGAGQQEQVYWGDSEPALYAVSTTASLDGLRGCLALDAQRKTTTETSVRLSAVRPCPTPASG